MKVMLFTSLLFLFEFKLLTIIMIHFNPKPRILAARMSDTKWTVSKTLVTADVCEVLTVGLRQCAHLLSVSPNNTKFIPILIR